MLTGVDGVWGLASVQNVVVLGQDVRRRVVSEDELRILERIEAAIDEKFKAALRLWPRNVEDDESEWEPIPAPNDFLETLSSSDRAIWDSCAGWDERIEQTVGLARSPDAVVSAFPDIGCWLVAVEHGQHPWAALRATTPMTAAEIAFDWSEVTVPGAGKLVLGHPRRQERNFHLVWPESKELPQQAQLDVQTGQLLTTPFSAAEGETDLLYRPLFRYAIVSNNRTRWLNLLADEGPEPLRPTTVMLCACEQ